VAVVQRRLSDGADWLVGLISGKEAWSLPCVDAALLFALLAILCEKDVDGLIRTGMLAAALSFL
jgi:hypothetical protein